MSGGNFGVVRSWMAQALKAPKTVIDALELFIADNSVTFAAMQDIPTDTLIGRDDAGAGNPQSITVGGGLGFTGSGGIEISDTGVTAGSYGDATHVSRVTLTAKGLASAASSVAITGLAPPAGASGAVLTKNSTADYDYSWIAAAAAGVTSFNTRTGAITLSTADVTTALGWFNVKSYGALGDGVTDDTTAIQAALDACATAGGGIVYFPRGVYIVGGALQDTGRSNAQLLLPRISCPASEAITIVLCGEASPSAVISVIGATPFPDNLSVIKGTLNTGSGTAPCLIGAHGPVGTFQNFTNVLLSIRDLTVQMPVNPVLTAVDASCVAQLDADNLLIHGGSFDVGSIAVQTTSASYGLKTPNINNGALTRLGTVNVVGFYTAFQINEHTSGRYVAAWGCNRGFEFLAAYHSSHFARLAAYHCTRGIVATGGDHYVAIDEYNIEHAASGTWVTTYDVDDASNYLHGPLRWHVVLAGTGVDTTFTVNGATNLAYRKLDKNIITSPTTGALAKFNDAYSITAGNLSGDVTTSGSLVATLAASGVSAGTYSNATVTVDAKGRVTSISAGAASGGYLPLVTGAEPPVLVSDGAGHLIAVGYAP